MRYSYAAKKGGAFELIDARMLNFTSENLRKDDYKIVWANGENVSLSIDGYQVLLQKNQLLFASPLNKLKFQIYCQKVMIYTFNKEFYCIRDHDIEVSCNGFLFLGTTAPLVVSLDKKEIKNFNSLYRLFIEEFKTVDNIQGEMLLVLLKRLLITSVRIARKLFPEDDIQDSKFNTIRKFNLLVQMYFREKHKVSDYAVMMNMTPKSLSNLFTKYHYQSPLSIITERIILEAKRLLNFSDKNINEIAFELGFEEVSHFSKLFKNHAGQSPKHYKEIG